jgi:hypothetical protein
VKRLLRVQRKGYYSWRNPFALTICCVFLSVVLLFVNRHLDFKVLWLFGVSIAVWVFSVIFVFVFFVLGGLYWVVYRLRKRRSS